MAAFYVFQRPLSMSEKAARLLDGLGLEFLGRLRTDLETLAEWTPETVEAASRGAAVREDVKLGQIAQPLRAALTGAAASPGLFEVMDVLGRAETLGRLDDALKNR